MGFSKKFIEEVKELYPSFTSLHKAIENGSGMVGRYLDDAEDGKISYTKILEANSLEELKQEARRIERRLNLYKSYMSGACYESEEERRKEVGCPRLYAQASADYPVLDAFECLCCHGYIPECPKFKSGECWDRFDELGFKLK